VFVNVERNQPLDRSNRVQRVQVQPLMLERRPPRLDHRVGERDVGRRQEPSAKPHCIASRSAKEGAVLGGPVAADRSSPGDAESGARRNYRLTHATFLPTADVEGPFK
jgi:hypothetical protein